MVGSLLHIHQAPRWSVTEEDRTMDQATFVKLMNECRAEQGLPPMTSQEETVDYQEWLREEEQASRWK